MSLPLEDIRHNFFHALDHFPSDLVRTLWLLQSIDIQLNECYNNNNNNNSTIINTNGDIDNNERSEYIDYLQSQLKKQSILLSKLVKDQKNVLNREKIQLNKQLHTRKRYQCFIKKLNDQKSIISNTTTNTKTSNNNNKRRKKSDMINITVENTGNQDLEPKYCICNDVSYGNMIACDNKDCPKQWFHYKCVGISIPPRGKWYCSVECEIYDNKKYNNNNKRSRALKKRNKN